MDTKTNERTTCRQLEFLVYGSLLKIVNLICFIIIILKQFNSKIVLLGAIEAIPAERKIVLLDKTTVKVVDAICTLNDILDSGVYLVETVEKKRQPYPTMDAVYFISTEQGSKSSSGVVSNDFSDKVPMYKSVHLFFTNGISNL